MPLDNQSATGSATKLGKYELLQEIAGSGVASTWTARAEGSPRSYAILRLHKHVTKKVEVADAFVKDAKNAKLLAHPNVVTMVEAGSADDEVFVVSENVEGESLSSLIAHAKAEGLPGPVVLRIALDMLSGLAAAHAQKPDALVHGELSPFHVIVGTDGVTRVAGFGWARALSKLGPHGIIKQDRLAYAPPERVKTISAAMPGSPTGAIEPKGDVFAAAVIIWEALAKQRLFASKMEAAVVQKVLSGPIPALSSIQGAKVPAGLAEVLEKALERDPAKRLASVEELVKAIEGAGAEQIAKPQEVAAIVQKYAGKSAPVAQPAPAAPPAPAPAKTASVARPAPAATPAPAKVTTAVLPRPGGVPAAPKGPVAAAKEPVGPAAPAPAAPAATPAPTKTQPGKPFVRQPTIVSGAGAGDAPKAAGPIPPVVAPKPAPKPEAAEAKAEAKPEAPKPGLKVPQPPKPTGIPKAPAPPALKSDALKPSPPMRPPAESLPADDLELAPESGPSKIGPKPEPPKVAAREPSRPEIKPEPPKVAAREPSRPEIKPEPPKVAVREPSRPEIKPEAATPEAGAPKPVAETPKEHLASTKPEMPAANTTTPASAPSPVDTDGVPPSRSKATALDKLKPGSTLGRYEILLRVAQGGMASVWAARLQGSRGFQKIVAVKTMLPDVSDDPDFESMFLDEARVAARIRHPNVVEIFDLGEQDEILYIVMDWVEGETLSAVLKAAKSLGGIPHAIVLRLASQICAGLHAAHELRDDSGALVDLVHRDISPANILVSTSGFAKIADFGVAKSRGRLYVTRTEGLVKGKTPYLSPEQLGGLPLDRRSDLFSLGVLLYLMVTGLHPFRGDTEFKTVENIALKEPIPPHEVIPTVNADFEKLILKTLEKDRNKRFATAAEMQRALDQIASQLGDPMTDEDVASFVRKVIGESSAKRAAELRAAIATADASGTSNSEGASIPPPPSVGNRAEAKAEATTRVEARIAPAAEDVPFNVFDDPNAFGPPAVEAAEAPMPQPQRIETLPSRVIMPVIPQIDGYDLEAIQAKQRKQRKTAVIMGGVAAVVIGGGLVAMSAGGDKPATDTTTAPEQAPTTQVAPTEQPKAEEPKVEAPKAEEPKAEEPKTEPATTAAQPEPPSTASNPGTTKSIGGPSRPTKTAPTKTPPTKTKTKKFDPTGI
jgi:serine/threonine protein kinase